MRWTRSSARPPSLRRAWHAEKMLNVENLYDPANMEILHCVNQALVAHKLYRLDDQYMIRDGQVLIVDEFTGRLMPGRRWSDGLHQAVEAKEGVKIEQENQTLATITFQNYFRMYDKLAGMTGTAETEAAEFDKIYKLDVLVIPTNRPLRRSDSADLVYKTDKGKWEAAADEIEQLHAKGQPVLVGTVSIEKSERMSALLKRRGVRHEVLNAKYHEREAEIIAQAGRKGAVTIATNMAGRGTDILLGANPEALAKAKADPETQPEEYAKHFAASMEACAKEHEEVVSVGGSTSSARSGTNPAASTTSFAARRTPGRSGVVAVLPLARGRPHAPLRRRSPQELDGEHDGGRRAHRTLLGHGFHPARQSSVEARNFEIRKHLLEYDDVMNQQRKTIYDLRRRILAKEGLREYLFETAGAILDGLVDQYAGGEGGRGEWDMEGLKGQTHYAFGVDSWASRSQPEREDAGRA